MAPNCSERFIRRRKWRERVKTRPVNLCWIMHPTFYSTRQNLERSVLLVKARVVKRFMVRGKEAFPFLVSSAIKIKSQLQEKFSLLFYFKAKKTSWRFLSLVCVLGKAEYVGKQQSVSFPHSNVLQLYTFYLTGWLWQNTDKEATLTKSFFHVSKK